MITPTDQNRLAAREKPTSPVVMRQDWSHLLFLHWEFPIDVIQAKLPEGITVDTFEGKAYLGIVPFFMEKIRPCYCPPVPGLSWFQELNLRTYVHDDQGRPGVWFFTLDCNQWLAVNIARSLFHLPYNHAKMSSAVESNQLTYTSKRQGDTESQVFEYPNDLQQLETAHAGTLELFLLERYRLFSQRKNGNLYSGLVHHTPYEFQHIDFPRHSTRIFSLCGFEEPSTPPVSSIIANKVSVEIHPLEKA